MIVLDFIFLISMYWWWGNKFLLLCIIILVRLSDRNVGFSSDEVCESGVVSIWLFESGGRFCVVVYILFYCCVV